MTTYPVSPNTVLANALTNAEDLLRPHMVVAAPERIVFVVGTQINGAPHIGTSLVQSLTFATAARIRDKFDVPAEVQFSALDNAPYAIVTDKETGHRYQRAYAQALGEDGIEEQVDKLYRPLFAALSERLEVPYSIETYSQQQAGEHYRRTWLRVLPRMAAARWYLSPSSGRPHVRVPCPRPGCGWAEKHAERTHVRDDGFERAAISAVCLHHGAYEVVIEPSRPRRRRPNPDRVRPRPRHSRRPDRRTDRPRRNAPGRRRWLVRRAGPPAAAARGGSDRGPPSGPGPRPSDRLTGTSHPGPGAPLRVGAQACQAPGFVESRLAGFLQ